MAGEPVRLEWRDSLRAHRGRLHSGPGPGDEVHAASFPRFRLIVLDSALRVDRAERSRIVTHELFHFVWLRLGNPRRRSWEKLLAAELERGARGELGWSSEWRKRRLTPEDVASRTRLWREYACESFCDTAAWRWSGLAEHPEHTLASRWRGNRKIWLDGHLAGPLRI